MRGKRGELGASTALFVGFCGANYGGGRGSGGSGPSRLKSPARIMRPMRSEKACVQCRAWPAKLCGPDHASVSCGNECASGLSYFEKSRTDRAGGDDGEERWSRAVRLLSSGGLIWGSGETECVIGGSESGQSILARLAVSRVVGYRWHRHRGYRRTSGRVKCVGSSLVTGCWRADIADHWCGRAIGPASAGMCRSQIR